MCAGELKVRCPACRKEVVRSPQSKAPFFPFCSERCKLLDLGKWLTEEHRIEEPLQPGGGGGTEPGKSD
jgi:endogenous inhibitor of DNA gyrase (YacG/DUF329 family)